ncbi:hypothetical protein GOBAR_DD15830 [Gossypium barbadense]|nr:hypothetical protein GOBAR_DD15830 [Gossypium barbadense]
MGRYRRRSFIRLEDLIRLVEDVEDDDKMNDLKEAFKMYEMEGCGIITPLGLKKMLARLGESSWSLQDCKLMIAHFDLNDFFSYRLS